MPRPKAIVIHGSYHLALIQPLNFVIDGGCVNLQKYAMRARGYPGDCRQYTSDAYCCAVPELSHKKPYIVRRKGKGCISLLPPTRRRNASAPSISNLSSLRARRCAAWGAGCTHVNNSLVGRPLVRVRVRRGEFAFLHIQSSVLHSASFHGRIMISKMGSDF